MKLVADARIMRLQPSLTLCVVGIIKFVVNYHVGSSNFVNAADCLQSCFGYHLQFLDGRILIVDLNIPKVQISTGS